MALGFRRNEMKKRLISLLLALVMILACLAGCSAKDDDEAVEDINEEASASAMTLVMYLLSEEKVSDEQANAVETAINKITKSKFKTQLDLRFYTADEYYTKLDEAFAARRAAEEAGLIASVDTEETTEEETFENEWGVSEIKYPSVASYQVDMFYLGGYANYNKYMDMGMLQRLDEELTSASKKLSAYISTPFLTYMKTANNGTYALPTNTAIGEYSYLLLSKEALAATNYDTDEGLKTFTSLTADGVKDYLEDIAAYHTGYQPLYVGKDGDNTISQDVLASTGVYYWGIGEDGVFNDSFSLLASTAATGKYGTKTTSYMDGMYSVLGDESAFVGQLKTVKKYYKDYTYDSAEAATAFANGKAAVAYIKGGADIPDVYADKYVAIPVGMPTLRTEDLYENMFAVTTYSANTSRSMEIITYLNTNEDMRNLLQYGILDEDYELVDSDYKDENGTPYKVAKLIPNDDGSYDYVMDINKTGNTLIAYCSEGQNPALISYIKEQNNVSLVSVTMGFMPDYNDMELDAEAFKKLREESAAVLKELLECEYDDYDEKVAELESRVDDVISALSLFAEPSDDDNACGLAYLYEQWGIAMKIYEKPAEEV